MSGKIFLPEIIIVDIYLELFDYQIVESMIICYHNQFNGDKN